MAWPLKKSVSFLKISYRALAQTFAKLYLLYYISPSLLQKPITIS
jgi:hypothetical protein